MYYFVNEESLLGIYWDHLVFRQKPRRGKTTENKTRILQNPLGPRSV